MTDDERVEHQRVKQDADMAAGCLGMIRDFLASRPCAHGVGKPHDTPPMLYPEWIACVIGKAVADEREWILSRLYDADGPVYLAVAKLCDEEFDTSGGLLGRVRDAAIAMRK